MVLLIALLTFTSVALLVFGAASAPRPSLFSARLDRIAPDEAASEGEEEVPSATQRPLFNRLLSHLGSLAGKSANLHAQLETAGYPGGWRVREFQGLRLCSVLVFATLSLPTAHYLGSSLTIKAAVALLVVVIGVCLPDTWLQSKLAARKALILRSLPDTLDLLVVSMEAGVSFDSAVAQVAGTMRGPLPQELRRALQEMSLGRARAEALKNMASRVQVVEVSRFINAVIQADRLGAGIASTLRIQSETARAQRLQRIREAAARLPTQMLFPLVFFLLPALFVTIIGPGLINLIRVLSH